MLTFEAPLVRVRLGKSVGFAEQAPPPRIQPPSPSARLLALAHRIVRAVEAGEVRDFSEAAKWMGVSQARVSMVVGLIFLAPEIQTRVLLGTGRRIGHKRLLRLARLEAWEEQLKVLKATERFSGRKSLDRNPSLETELILAQIPLEPDQIWSGTSGEATWSPSRKAAERCPEITKGPDCARVSGESRAHKQNGRL